MKSKINTNNVYAKQTHRDRKQTSRYQRGEGKDQGSQRWNEDIQTTMYKINDKYILRSTGNYRHYLAVTFNGV